MLEHIRVLLDAARFRLSCCDQYGEGYSIYRQAEALVEALERAETAAENYATLARVDS